MVYNVLAKRKHRLRVRSVAFLLRPEADGPCMREPFVEQFDGEDPYLRFEFRVVLIPLLHPSCLGRSRNPGNSQAKMYWPLELECCLSLRSAICQRAHCQVVNSADGPSNPKRRSPAASRKTLDINVYSNGAAIPTAIRIPTVERGKSNERVEYLPGDFARGSR